MLSNIFNGRSSNFVTVDEVNINVTIVMSQNLLRFV